jgi:hypothetical protein
LKRFFAIFALVGILLQTFSQVVIVAEYYANKEYIAKNLCENRDKPKMHCDGKCCLRKKLAKEGKEQGPTPRSQRNEETVVLFFEQTNITLPTGATATTKPEYYSYNDLDIRSYSAPIFHPPGA